MNFPRPGHNNLLRAMPSMPRKRLPRRAQRYPVRWPVAQVNGQPVQDFWVVDISSLGARLETTKILGVHMPLKFTLTLPDHRGEMEISGQVVWMRPVFHLPGKFHQGIRFFGPIWDLERLAKHDQA